MNFASLRLRLVAGLMRPCDITRRISGGSAAGLQPRTIGCTVPGDREDKMSNLEKLQEFYDARAKFDKEKHLSFVHDACVYRMVGSDKLHPMTMECATPAARRKAADDTFAFWDMSQLDNVSIHECGDTIYVHRRGKVGFIPNGASMQTEFIDKLTFKDGKIVEYLQFLDTFGVKDFLTEQGV